MNRKNVFMIVTTLCSSSFFAQADNALEWGAATPTEVYACDVREGSSAEKDTMNFVKDWKEWALENTATPPCFPNLERQRVGSARTGTAFEHPRRGGSGHRVGGRRRARGQ